ncbi:hypothetical protein ACIA03_06105 [Nocardioides sp. NPDC051685]|uniref:hypothetical protein n=1 Tax=Nocardioides sp. NPDC051685 TaxID=3364334 RepID=UPI00378EF4BD
MKATTAAWLRSRLTARIKPGDDSHEANAERDQWFAAVDRTLVNAPPLTDEKAQRLANLLGLKVGGGADAA